jgi:hypothetical protein
MKTTDFSTIILTYNLLIGLLLVAASEKLGAVCGGVIRVNRQRVAVLTRTACVTFGLCLVVLSVGVLLFNRFSS